MSEWIRIDSYEKPIQGNYVITRFKYEQDCRARVAIYTRNKFYRIPDLIEITDYIDGWTPLPHKFKGE